MAHPVLHAPQVITKYVDVPAPPPQVITVEPQICGACCNYLASGGLCVVCPLLKTIRDLETQLKVPNAPVIYPQGGCSFSDSAMVKVMCSDLNGWGNPCDATLYVTIDGSAPRHQSSLSLSLSLSLSRFLSLSSIQNKYLTLCVCVRARVLFGSEYNYQYSGRSPLSFIVADTRRVRAVAMIANNTSERSPVSTEVMTKTSETAGVGLLLEQVHGLKGIYVQGIRVCARARERERQASERERERECVYAVCVCVFLSSLARSILN